MEIIEKLDKIITEQTRNGRTQIYVEKNDLRKLGVKISGTGYQYIDLFDLKILMRNYDRKQFIDRIKVNEELIKNSKQLTEQTQKIMSKEREKEI